MKSSSHNRRVGYTLVEVAVSLIAASFLAIGLSSAMFVSFRATGSDMTPGLAIFQGSEFLNDLRMDVEYAKEITQDAPRSITVIVPDRTGDSIDDTIQYSNSPQAGEPLVRQFNGGASENILANVHQFNIEYDSDDGAIVSLTIEIQVGAQPGAILQSSFPLYNRP